MLAPCCATFEQQIEIIYWLTDNTDGAFQLTANMGSVRVAPYRKREKIMANEKPIEFEQSLAQLEQLVQKLESGDMALEDSLQAFETGVALVRQCQQSLQTAEQRVQKLMVENGQPVLSPFEERE